MLSGREQKLLRGLVRRKIRKQEGRLLAEGVRVVEDLLASPLEVSLVVSASSLEDTERGQALVAEVERRRIPHRRVAEGEIGEFAETQASQGVLAVAGIPQWDFSALAGGKRPVILALDAVQDPGNFGTLIRSAEALGAAGVLALSGTVDPWNPKVIRASAGSSFRIPIVESNWDDAIQWLRVHGFRVLASASGGNPLPGPVERPTVIVVGNEGAGVSPDVLHGADEIVGIPLRGRAESLNVSTAAAILLFDLLR